MHILLSSTVLPSGFIFSNQFRMAFDSGDFISICPGFEWSKFSYTKK